MDTILLTALWVVIVVMDNLCIVTGSRSAGFLEGLFLWGLPSILVLLGVALSTFLLVVLPGSKGFTLGKFVLGLRVLDSQALSPLGIPRMLLRCLVQLMLSILFLGILIDWLWASIDPNNRSLHDLAASSIVVTSQPPLLFPSETSFF